MGLCLSHSPHQLIAEPTRTTKCTKTLTDYILTSFQGIQIGAIDMGVSDLELISWSKKMSLMELDEH